MSISYKELLPRNDLILSRAVSDAKLFIEAGIWRNITLNSLESWLSNFKTEEEILLSAFLLKSFIYRSDLQTTSLIKNAITSVLPCALGEDAWQVLERGDFLKEMTDRNQKPTALKIVPVIRDIDSPTKSGPLLARLYRRNANINEKYFIWHWNIADSIEQGDVNTIVFIDDIIASGNQFSKFIKNCVIQMESSVKFIYLPLLACKQGIENTKASFPSLEVYPVEVINEEINFFGMNSKYSDLKDLYQKVEKKMLNRSFLRNYTCGYEQLALTVAYNHSTPNATLPLYWYESEDFFPLVRR